MHLTVAVCTWNRAELLEQCLAGMALLRIPPEVTWELLIVDNNSTDDTAKVIGSFENRLPVRRLFEPRPGKSHALNLAVQHASGEYILWTDDDVLVEPTWLEAYAESFRRHPAAGFFGGTIRPLFLNPPPEWLRRGMVHVAGAFAVRDLGPDEMRLTNERVPYGANMAVRTSVQRAFPFDPSLGPRPESALRGEETEVVRRMTAEGIEGWWVPGAVVHHHVPPERQTTLYVRCHYMGFGEQLHRAMADAGADIPHLFGRPRWLWRDAVVNELRYRIGRLWHRPEDWIVTLRNASMAWGGLGLSWLWSHRR